MAAERQKTQAKSAESDAREQPKDKRADYLTARQLAEVLQVSEATIHRLRRTGRIPAVMLTDRLIRFNLRDVQRALRPQIAASVSGESDEGTTPQLSFDDLLSDLEEGKRQKR